MENKKENGQTLVIGSLLLLSLAVSLIIYTQIAIFPQINERTEFSELKDSTESMKNVESEISTVATVGGSKSVQFDNKISYIPQPAGPPDQLGQLNTRGTEPIELRNKNSVVSFMDVNEFGPNGPQENRYHKIVSYQPRLIELSSTGRRIVYDNTVVGVTESRQDDFTTVSSQDLIKDDTINIVHLVSSQESGFKSPEEELSFTRIESGTEVIEPDTSNSDPLELEFSTSYSSGTWDNLTKDENVSNGGNVEDVVDRSGNRVAIKLSRTPNTEREYTLNYARILVN